MQKRTETANNSNFKKADGFLNIELKIQAKDGNWYSIKGGIPLHADNAVQRGLMNNPDILEDSSRIEMTASVHRVSDQPDNIEF